MTNKWVHCPICGHRMFFIRDGKFAIEIKCTSCKQIIDIDTEKGWNNEKVVNADRTHDYASGRRYHGISD